MNLVELHKNEPFAESHLVARKIGVKHNRFIEKSDLVINKIGRFRGQKVSPKYYFETRIYRGQEFKVCLMSREFFSLVMMRFETQKAFDWQVKFNSAFYEMERQLLQVSVNKSDPQWLEQRQQTKALRHDTTDVFQQFVEYAKAQGSNNAGFYYKHLTNATYKSLGMLVNKRPKLRDTLDSLHLSWLMTAESIAQQALLKYMSQGMHYKDIYKQVSKDVINWAEPLLLIDFSGGNK